MIRKAPSVKKKIGALIRKNRLRCGLTQDVVADAFNVSTQTIRNWEAGRCAPSGGRMSALELYFSMSRADTIELRSLMYGRCMNEHLVMNGPDSVIPSDWFPAQPEPVEVPPVPVVLRPDVGFALPPLHQQDVERFLAGP